MKLIVLDIDGVLNCRSTKDKCGPYLGIESHKMSLLKQIVDYTGAEIALISTWKENYYLKEEEKYKQDDFADHLDMKLKEAGLKISYIIPDYYQFNDRAEFIAFFLYKMNTIHHIDINYKDIVILDDIDFGYTNSELTKDRFVQTSFDDDGLTPAHVEKAIFLLNGK